VWSYCGPRCRLVHRTVLRALLFTDCFEGERALRAIYRRDRAVAGGAALRIYGSAVRSHRAQVDHDARLFTRGDFLHADLFGNATCGGFECSDGHFAEEQGDRRYQPDSTDRSERPASSRPGSAALRRLLDVRQFTDRLEADRARVYSGVVRDDGVRTDRGLPGRGLSG